MKKPTRQQKARAKARIAIARDVIAQLKAKKYHAQTGTYIEGLDTTPVRRGKSVDLRSHLKRTLKPSKPCTVCALGSAFLSCVRIYDHFDLNSNTVGSSCETTDIRLSAMRRKLREFFTIKELGAIESSFERALMRGVSETEWNNVPQGYKEFLYNIMGSKKRLIWLMNAIIRIGDGRITLKALEQQALLSIVFDKEYEGWRWSALRPSEGSL